MALAKAFRSISEAKVPVRIQNLSPAFVLFLSESCKLVSSLYPGSCSLCFNLIYNI